MTLFCNLTAYFCSRQRELRLFNLEKTLGRPFCSCSIHKKGLKQKHRKIFYQGL